MRVRMQGDAALQLGFGSAGKNPLDGVAVYGAPVFLYHDPAHAHAGTGDVLPRDCLAQGVEIGRPSNTMSMVWRAGVDSRVQQADAAPTSHSKNPFSPSSP